MMRRNAMAEYPLGTPDDLLADPLGAYLNYKGASKAANVQGQAANTATDVAKQMFEQNRQDQMPWMQAGKAGLNQYAQLMGLRQGEGGEYTYDPSAATGAMQMDPGYQFRMQQGQRAIENSAAARGGLLSGNTARALTEYGQDYGSNEFQNILNRYAALSGVGQSQTNQLGAQRTNLGSAIGQNAMTGAAARASGYMALPNAYAGMKDEALRGVGMILGRG